MLTATRAATLVHPQLKRVFNDFYTAELRLGRLLSRTPTQRWSVRAQPERWSVAECIAHLNLTSRAFIPLLRAAIGGAAHHDSGSGYRYRRDFIGWLLYANAGPPVRVRTKTTAAFVPSGASSRAELFETFLELQDELYDLVRAAEGRRVDRVNIVSPFDARVRYSAWSALTILPRHQHRHLWQAEQVWAQPAREVVS